MWYVDLTNATGNWGSADADTRCARESIIKEIASLSKEHVTRHRRAMTH